ncbi:MAG: hypothetical protein SPI15_10145 [Candidatus Faecousia sp.]|nr:hypothetical protein [Clostridiales bacterium]MDY6181196.1 hypothetical protein [Candidatus Faecousia sp.]
MPTVTTATASLNVDVRFVCSSCGTPNIVSTTLHTYGNSAQAANLRMQSLLAELSSPDLTKRYARANLQCRCMACKRKQPWTGMKMDRVNIYLWVLGVLGGVMALGQSAEAYLLLYLPLFLIIYMFPFAVLLVYKIIRVSVYKKKLAALAPQCLPVVTIRPKETSQSDIMARVQENMNRK